jgi:hypothetical protein
MLFMVAQVHAPISTNVAVKNGTAGTSPSAISPLVSTPKLTLSGLTTLNPGVTKYASISSNCYSVLVNMTALTNSTTLQVVEFSYFYITIILPNQVVGNTTNTSFFKSNNLISEALLFPTIPVVMQISFYGVCLPPNTNAANDIKLAYYDGTILKLWTPTFGAGNTITWN